MTLSALAGRAFRAGAGDRSAAQIIGMGSVQGCGVDRRRLLEGLVQAVLFPVLTFDAEAGEQIAVRGRQMPR